MRSGSCSLQNFSQLEKYRRFSDYFIYGSQTQFERSCFRVYFNDVPGRGLGNKTWIIQTALVLKVKIRYSFIDIFIVEPVGRSRWNKIYSLADLTLVKQYFIFSCSRRCSSQILQYDENCSLTIIYLKLNQEKSQSRLYLNLLYSQLICHAGHGWDINICCKAG